MIHRVDPKPGDTYPVSWVVASRRVWLPGNYDSERTARWAFQFTDAELLALQERVNVGEQRPISRDDLRALR